VLAGAIGENMARFYEHFGFEVFSAISAIVVAWQVGERLTHCTTTSIAASANSRRQYIIDGTAAGVGLDRQFPVA
jgi:hypothetical protein